MTPTHRDRRAGSISLIGLLILGIVLALFVWVVLSGQTRYQREHMQIAADAAALAAAEEMVDDCWLSGDANALNVTLARARRCAQEFAQRNPIQGACTPIRDNPTNTDDGDVCFGHFPLCGDARRFYPGPNFGASSGDLDSLDAVRIIIHRDKDHDDTRLKVVHNPAACDGKLEGLAASIACLDRFVYGFCPRNGQRVPFVPIALYSGTGAHCWESQVGANGSNDRYSFRRESQSFTKGSDAIPELTVRLGSRPGNDEDSVTALLVRTTDADLTGDGKLDIDDMIAQVSTGLSGTHLQGGFAGCLKLNDYGQLAVDCTDDIQTKKSNRTSLRSALNDLRNSGRAVIFPLYQAQGNGGSSATLTGFVAARIIAVQLKRHQNGGNDEDDNDDTDDDDDAKSGNGHAKSIVLVVQPAMISVPAAMTDPCRTVNGAAIAPNPYIAKVRLGR